MFECSLSNCLSRCLLDLRRLWAAPSCGTLDVLADAVEQDKEADDPGNAVQGFRNENVDEPGSAVQVVRREEAPEILSG